MSLEATKIFQSEWAALGGTQGDELEQTRQRQRLCCKEWFATYGSAKVGAALAVYLFHFLPPEHTYKVSRLLKIRQDFEDSCATE